MKLKTLKDCYMSDGRNYEQRLKEEALKWIKELEKELLDISLLGVWVKSGNPKKQRLLNEKFHTMQGKIDWIKHFFNISEEDLKGEAKGG